VDVLRFKAVKYERPHSKTLEIPALAGTQGQMSLHFKALKCYNPESLKDDRRKSIQEMAIKQHLI